MLVVRVTENIRAVQSSYYSSCPYLNPLKGAKTMRTNQFLALGAAFRMGLSGLREGNRISEQL
jgi:hypothetical protein